MKEKNIKHTCNKNYVLRMNMLLFFLSNITQSKKQNEIKGLIVFLLKIKK